MGIEKILSYEEVKGLLHVKEKERDTFTQIVDERKAKMKEKLRHLGSVTEDLHKEVAFHKSGGQHVVSKLFVARPREKACMKDKDLKTSALMIDQKAFEVSRELGNLRYQVDRAQEKYLLRQQELAETKEMLEHNPADEKIKEFLKAQSKVELVKMRLMDAENTSAFYKKIIHNLKKEIFDASEQIKLMTKYKREKTNIVSDMKHIMEGAVAEFKQVQDRIRPLRTTIDNKTHEHEDNLRKKRKEHQEQQRDTNTKCMGEIKVDSMEEEKQDGRKAKELMTTMELKTYQDVFDDVKEALEISDVKDVLLRVHEEHCRYQRLCDQLEESNHLYDMLVEDLEELKEELAALTYDSTLHGMTDAEERNLQQEAEFQMQRLQEALATLKDKEKTIAGIKLATVAIHSKLIYVKLPPANSDNQAKEMDKARYEMKRSLRAKAILQHATQPQTTILVGDPVKDMEVIWAKTEKMIARYGKGNMEEEHHDEKELQKFMEYRLPEDNLRTVLRPLDYRSRDNLRYEFDDVQSAFVTREDIKKRHMDIIKPKKRKSASTRRKSSNKLTRASKK